jgi:VCBS repeat-containing protein
MALTYYLTIDGLNGGSLSQSHSGAFEISGYDFDVSLLTSTLAGGGISTGRPDFAPLSIDLDLNSGQTSLLSDLATSKLIKSIRIEGVTNLGGTEKTVYDLKLGDVFITKYHDTNTGHDNLLFEYAKVGLTTTPQKADGSFGTPVTTGWDIAAKKAISNANLIPNPVVGAGSATGGGTAQTYYLTIDGLNGGSLSQSHSGAFEISGYDFDVSLLSSGLAGGGSGISTGKPDFAPLSIDLDLNSGQTSLLSGLASGTRIRSIRIEGVTNLGGTEKTVYDLKLGDVLITKYHDTNTGHDNLLFEYTKVSLTTTPQKADGSLGTPVATGWDIAANKAIANTNLNTAIPNPVAGAGSATGGNAQTYYLTIDGINGGSVSNSHRGAFEISGYDFDASILTTVLAGGGIGRGKPTFSPLSIDLDLNSGQTSLLSDLASGTRIKSIRIEGVINLGGTEKTVYDLKLGDAVITKYHDTNTGHDNLLFEYAKVGLTTTPQKADGSFGTPVTTGWDVAANRVIATNTDIDRAIPNPVAGASSSTGVTAQTYYLTVDGVNGGSLSQSHSGAFEISGYDFDVSILSSGLAGGGIGTGKTDFAPLSIDLDLNSGQTSLLSDLASSKLIKSIRIEGVTNLNGTEQTVYDLKLGDVVITKYHDTNTGHDNLLFEYAKVGLTTTPQKADGSLGTPVTTGWDIAANKAGVTVPDPVVGTGTVTGGGNGQTYYLTIDGLNGGSVSNSHRGAFEISGYDFDASILTTVLAGGGISKGKPTFSPLSIDLDLNSGQTSLLSDLASGTRIKSIRIEGVTNLGGTEKTVYDLKLGDVVITKYHDTNTGHDNLLFEYAKVALTTTPQRADGSLGTPVATGWDIAANKAIADANLIPNPAVGASIATGGNAQTYYLTIDGINGGSLSQSHSGAFEISGYDFDASILTNMLAGGGIGTGKPDFAPLSIDLDLNSGQTSLLSDLTSTKLIKSIRIEGVTNLGGTEKTVYDLKLGNVVITKYHDTNTGHDNLLFKYTKVALTTTPQKADGSLGTPVTTGWDIPANKAGATVPDPVPVFNSPPIVSAALTSNKSEDDSTYSINLLQGVSDADKTDVLTASTVSFSAVDNNNNSVNVSGLTQLNNSLSVDPSAYNYLEAGQFVAIIGNYSISDGQGETVPQTIGINIAGVNDIAIISGTTTGIVAEDAASPTLTATGTLSIIDADTGENKFSTAVASAPGNLGNLTIADTGAWSYSVTNNTVQSLGAGITKTETFTVKSFDGTATQDIKVTIVGVNDTATIGGTATGSVTEDAASPNLTTTGTLSITDADVGENKFNTTVTSASGNLGTLTITDTGVWNYSVVNSAVQSLGAGQTKSETFTVKSLDGSATQDIKVTITGVNDAPIAEPSKLLTLAEDAAPTPLNIAAPTDIDGDPLTLLVNTLPDSTKGQIRLNDGSIVTAGQSLSVAELTSLVFAPAPNANGSAGSFSYTVNDGQGGIASQSITLDITPDNTGGSTGDPHIITFDQLHYDFQATGDFVLTRALDSDLEVQVRQTPWALNPSATLNVALATVVDGNRVEFYIDQPSPIVNGTLLALQPGETQTLGKGRISRTAISGYGMQGDLYTVAYPNGDVLSNQVFSRFLMDPSLDLAGSKTVVGLLGNNNGNADDDLALQDSTVLSNPLDPAVLYGDFANSWRVSDAQSLFSTASNPSSSISDLDRPDGSNLHTDLVPALERFVLGGNGNDTLIGVQNPLVNPGNGEVDLLMGNKGADTFVLGDKNNPYYVGLGQQDYALIADFWVEDSIQLHGSAGDYVLGTAPVNAAKGTGIFLASDLNELIGIIQGDAISNLSLSNASMFHFV